MQENGKFGSNVNIHGGEQPSLATDVFNVIPKLDATAMKGPLSSVTMAIAEKKQAATFESESVDYAKHYKSSFDIG